MSIQKSSILVLVVFALVATLLVAPSERFVDGCAGAPGLRDVRRAARRARSSRERDERAKKLGIRDRSDVRWPHARTNELWVATLVCWSHQGQLRFFAARAVPQGGA